ncbi:hypothetical protein [Kineosporia sp. NBRC 101731]|uniref:phosphotransferase-like protein n=1 Tax=Kineosporia sp. NBRC 101731 TaxID=3032199 RepID=UPI0024A178DB|nr:hypothetical protein [Kineosporia sp. NBRC 101731]GLY29600.1 hypothetical protein Kisp02_29650 [Kineosporia sp. NBRC 101731]
MTTQVIVLNGGSSSGKTGITRCLQAVLPQPWIRLGVDDLIKALPARLLQSDAGIEMGQDGQVEKVHEGVVYDVEVDTGRTESLICARIIADHVG